MREFNPGDYVTWRSSSGRSYGWVKAKVTKEVRIKGHTAKPSKAHPQYIVVSDKGNEAVHRPEALQAVSELDAREGKHAGK